MRAYKKAMKVAGTRIIWDQPIHIKCDLCGEEWFSLRTNNGRLFPDWYKCHLGCSEHRIKRAIKSMDEMNKTIQKLFDN